MGPGVPYLGGTNLRPLLPDGPALAVKQPGLGTGYLVALIGSGLDPHESSVMGSEEGLGAAWWESCNRQDWGQRDWPMRGQGHACGQDAG